MQGYPSGFTPPQPSRPPPARGALLTLLLLGMTGGAAWTMLTAWLSWARLGRGAAGAMSSVTDLAHAKKLLMVMLVSGALQLVSAIGLWMWKQWGVFAFASMALLQMFLWSHVTANHTFSYRPLVMTGLLVVAVAPRWSDFER